MSNHTQLLHGSLQAVETTFRAAQQPERLINHVKQPQSLRRLLGEIAFAAFNIGLIVAGLAYLLH